MNVSSRIIIPHPIAKNLMGEMMGGPTKHPFPHSTEAFPDKPSRGATLRIPITKGAPARSLIGRGFQRGNMPI
jgi:hypothetical protein